MADDEYLAAAREAKEALHDFLMECEPDTGAALRVAYGELRRIVESNGADVPSHTESEAQERERQEERRRKNKRYAAWQNEVSPEQREAYVFRFLGTERLSLGELTARMNEELKPEIHVFKNRLSQLLKAMIADGQLERERDDRYPNQLRYRYFRKSTLEGPIADLQSQFDGGES
jgi:hypothetical protein